MGVRASLYWVGAAVMVLGATGSATAQPATSPSATGQVGFERHANLSVQDELAQADVTISKMEGTSSTVRRQLDVARQGRDVVRSLCLSDKLSQTDVAVRSAHDRQAALQAAAQRGDAELANHEYTILTVLRQRAEQLSAEANQCIGEEVAFVGQTQIVTQVDPNLPAEESASYPPASPPSIVLPPQPVSGTQ